MRRGRNDAIHASSKRERRPTDARERSLVPLLWLIVLILVILAIGGGVAVNSLLWLVLVVAVIVALFAVASGRRV